MSIGNHGADHAMRGILAAILLLVTSSLAAAQAPAPPQLQVGLAAAADFSVVYPGTVFRSPVNELSASFRLAGGEAFEQLTARWIAVDVGDAAPLNFEIIASNLALKGMKSGRLRYEQPQPLPAGKYRIEVAADGAPWQSAEFEITPPDAAPPPPGGLDLVPLAPGRQWTYRLEQRAGEGARLDLPGVVADADGVFRATVELKVAGSNADGTHLITLRNGEPVFEEWWRLDESGLWSTRRRQDGDDIVIDPPQRLAAAPGKQHEWTYPPFEQGFRMWGPLPMSGAWGGGEGYIVLLRQPADAPLATVERHFVPGIGMVREVIVQALAGRMLSRQEMELTDHRE